MKTLDNKRVDHLRKLAKRCGTWSIARMLCKEGWPIEYAVLILATKESV